MTDQTPHAPYEPTAGQAYPPPVPPRAPDAAWAGAPQAAPYPAPAPMSPADERMWATLVHVVGIFVGWVAPLIGYLVFKDRGPFVRAHTATALNFQLTMLIASVVGGILTFVLIGFVILFAVWALSIIFSIIAAVKANRGEWYQYPLSIPFVR